VSDAWPLQKHERLRGRERIGHMTAAISECTCDLLKPELEGIDPNCPRHRTMTGLTLYEDDAAQARLRRRPLAVLIDTRADTITISGVDYPAELFRRAGALLHGTPGTRLANAHAAMEIFRRAAPPPSVTSTSGPKGDLRWLPWAIVGLFGWIAAVLVLAFKA
jgi:hypothetical protein